MGRYVFSRRYSCDPLCDDNLLKRNSKFVNTDRDVNRNHHRNIKKTTAVQLLTALGCKNNNYNNLYVYNDVICVKTDDSED